VTRGSNPELAKLRLFHTTPKEVLRVEGLRLWISVKKTAALTGRKEKAIYEQIRTGRFPFKYRRAGRAILISALDIGLVEANEKLGTEPTEPQAAGATA